MSDPLLKQRITDLTSAEHRAEALRLLTSARWSLEMHNYDRATAYATVAGVHAAMSELSKDER